MNLTAPHQTSSHVLAQTWADGRHEWAQAASLASRVSVIARLVVALLRAGVLVTVADAQKAIHTPLVRRWLVASFGLALALWIGVAVRPGRPWYLVDLGQVHLVVMLPVLAVLAFARRRDRDDASLLGSVVVVEAVGLIWLLLLLPLGFAARYAAAYHGRTYVAPPVQGLAEWVLLMAAASAAILAISARVIQHPRRPFMTCLAFLLPVLAGLGVMELYDLWQPTLIRWSIGRWEVMVGTASMTLGLLYAGLAWEERTADISSDSADLTEAAR